MIRYQVAYEAAARADLDNIYGFIADDAGMNVADRFMERLRVYSDGLEYAPKRGMVRDDLKTGLRLITFDSSVSIAYLVGERRVDIVRFIYRGRSLSPDMF